MKILYITQYFYPEIGATTNRALANVRNFAENGHDVTVLTEMPNHPRGIIFEDYKRKLFIKEKMENFHIHRVWVYTNPKKSSITRLFFYGSFMLLGTLHTVFNWKNFDLVYVTSPPLFVGKIGLWLKKIYPNIKFVFEVRDLWPDAAIEMGELNNPKIIHFSHKLEKALYNNSNLIIAVTQRFKQRIIKKGIPKEKIKVIRNGSDLSYQKINPQPELLSKYKKSYNFLVVYAGNLGLAQNLKTILQAAKKLEMEKIGFLFLGSGPEKQKLLDHKKREKINNVHFVGEIPKVEVNKYFSIADCGVIPLRNIKVFETTIPSKLFDYMSASLPILLGVKGEAKEILQEAEAGISFEPDSAEDLTEKILVLKNNPEQMEKYQNNGRKFVSKNFNRNKLATQLLSILEILVEKK